MMHAKDKEEMRHELDEKFQGSTMITRFCNSLNKYFKRRHFCIIKHERTIFIRIIFQNHHVLGA